MKIVTIAALALCLGGCITQQTMPLAPNVVRLDTRASGLLFTGQTVPQTMRAAAEATLKAGYTHFKLSDTSSGVGETEHAACSWNRYGGGCGSVVRPVSGVGTTVTMFHANEPGAKDAFDAQQLSRTRGTVQNNALMWL